MAFAGKHIFVYTLSISPQSLTIAALPAPTSTSGTPAASEISKSNPHTA